MRFDGNALRRLREQRGYSRGQLAAASGISHSTIQRLEMAPRSNPLASTARNLAVALGRPIDDMIVRER